VSYRPITYSTTLSARGSAGKAFADFVCEGVEFGRGQALHYSRLINTIYLRQPVYEFDCYGLTLAASPSQRCMFSFLDTSRGGSKMSMRLNNYSDLNRFRVCMGQT